MRITFIAYAITLLVAHCSIAQNIITGKVYDDQTKEPLVGANVIVKDLNLGTTTSVTGAFELHSETP